MMTLNCDLGYEAATSRRMRRGHRRGGRVRDALSARSTIDIIDLQNYVAKLKKTNCKKVNFF
jgi:hypothetical protein